MAEQIVEQSTAPADQPAELVQIGYRVHPRKTDDHRDIHQYDFAPTGAIVPEVMVDLGVAAGVSYPSRLGVTFSVARLTNREGRLTGEAMPGTVKQEPLDILARGLLTVFQQFEATVAQAREAAQAPTGSAQVATGGPTGQRA